MGDHVVRPTQTSLMQGIYILDGAVTLHEIVHELYRKKMNGVILKIESEKAYNKVKWSFLQQTLEMKRFFYEWRVVIHNFVFGRSVAVKVNDDVVRFFQTKIGLR
jgi:predicted GNAT superfamily acetyltransferase